jgi:hypothetical protein
MTPSNAPPPRELGQRESEPDANPAYFPAAKAPGWLVTAFWLLVAAVTVGVGYFVQSRFEAERRTADNQLRSVAELKISQLVNWRQERLGDAIAVANLPGLADTLSQLSIAPGSSPPFLREIDHYLNAARAGYGYRDIHLLDRSLRPLRSYPPDRVWDGVLTAENRRELLATADRGNRDEPVVFEDLHRDASGLVSLYMLVRVRSASGDLAGVALLSIAAESTLYPLLQTWPVKSATAETLLIRREGDSLLYLSPLRFKPDTALRLRLPLSSDELIAARALRTGAGGLVVGTDYRGVAGVGIALPVPGTPWVMVAKLDQSEAYAKAWRESRQLAVALLFLVVIRLLFGRAWLNFRERDHIRQKLGFLAVFSG